MTTSAILFAKWGAIQALLRFLIRTADALEVKVTSLNLKRPDGITFDPLGVAAILHNPRAERSAARLYTTTEHDKRLFRWPHTTMFGGALIPLKTLVEHLTSSMSSLHPAVVMSMKDTVKIRVLSDMIFKELLFNFSNVWLRDVIAFKPSNIPQNDIVIVLLETKDTPDEPLNARCWFRKLIIDLTGFATGLILLGGTCFSILSGDMWAAVLFGLFGLHWLASTIISFSELVTYHTPQVAGVQDSVGRFAVYEREEGGMVVFKGPGIVFEKLARSRWMFETSSKNNILHWFWMISGTLSAISSVACMVNMSAHLQLVFLGVLSYSSMAEIWITQLARSAQSRALGTTEENARIRMVKDKSKRAISMIYATLGVEKKFRLEGIDWIKLKLLPSSFSELQVLLDTLSDPKKASGDKGSSTDILDEAIRKFERDFKIQDKKLIDVIVEAVRKAWEDRQEDFESSVNC